MRKIDSYVRKIIDLFYITVGLYFPDINNNYEFSENYYCVYNSLFNMKIYIEDNYLDFSLYDEMLCNAPIDMIIKFVSLEDNEIYNEIESKLEQHFKEICVGIYSLNHLSIKNKLAKLITNEGVCNLKAIYDFGVEIINVEISSQKHSLSIRFDFRLAENIFIGIYCSEQKKIEENIINKYLSINMINNFLEQLKTI